MASDVTRSDFMTDEDDLTCWSSLVFSISQAAGLWVAQTHRMDATLPTSWTLARMWAALPLFPWE